MRFPLCPAVSRTLLALSVVVPAGEASAQVDERLAQTWFDEAAAICARDAGRLWGISLCGPMVFADAATQTMATSQPRPAADPPRILGFANTALQWGGVRWATYVWQGMPVNDSTARRRLLMHELFHRVEPQLGLMTPDGRNDHLDTLVGRYWMRLEWRALARALGTTGAERTEAIGDALAFRMKRHSLIPGAAENEQPEEIREGLAQYTGTVLSTSTPADAAASAIEQLERAEGEATFVRVFAYPSGAAWGILLDATAPGWRQRTDGKTDLGQLLMATANVPTRDAESAAARYDGAALLAFEERRDEEQRAKVAELRRRFVDGPVLVMPLASGGAFVTTGATPIPEHGTVFLTYRITAEWGHFETTSGVLVSPEARTLTVPAPASLEGRTLTGDGWTLTLAAGWIVRPGDRAGDGQVAREGTERRPVGRAGDGMSNAK